MKKRARLSAADAAAVLSLGNEGGVTGSSDLARPSQRVEASRIRSAHGLVSSRLLGITRLPRGHPERKTARAKLLLYGRERWRR